MLKGAVAILAILVIGTLAFSVMRTSSIASELEKTNGEVARDNEALRAKLGAAE